jgi:predicted hydrolase (HD superfamily)
MLKGRRATSLFEFQRAPFSFTHNFHHPPQYYVNGIKHVFDYDITQYKPQIQAFLQKRWTSKREVHPKIAIMDDMGAEYETVYRQQRLAPGEQLYDIKTMERFYGSDNITT